MMGEDVKVLMASFRSERFETRDTNRIHPLASFSLHQFFSSRSMSGGQAAE